MSDVQASILRLLSGQVSIDTDELVNRSGTVFQKLYIHSVIKHFVPAEGHLMDLLAVQY